MGIQLQSPKKLRQDIKNDLKEEALFTMPDEKAPVVETNKSKLLRELKMQMKNEEIIFR